jgi:hypothetical protein
MAIPIFRPTERALERYGEGGVGSFIRNVHGVLSYVQDQVERRRQREMAMQAQSEKSGYYRTKLNLEQRRVEGQERFQAGTQAFRERELEEKRAAREATALRQAGETFARKAERIAKQSERQEKKRIETLRRTWTGKWNRAKIKATRKGLTGGARNQFIAGELEKIFEQQPDLAGVAEVEFQKPENISFVKDLGKMGGLQKYLALTPEQHMQDWMAGTSKARQELFVLTEQLRQQLGPNKQRVAEALEKNGRLTPETFNRLTQATEEEALQQLRTWGLEK